MFSMQIAFNTVVLPLKMHAVDARYSNLSSSIHLVLSKEGRWCSRELKTNALSSCEGFSVRQPAEQIPMLTSALQVLLYQGLQKRMSIT